MSIFAGSLSCGFWDGSELPKRITNICFCMRWSKFGPHNHATVCTGSHVIRRGFWYTLLACAISLCLLHGHASAQQIDAREFETEDQLFFALLATATNDPSTAQALLNSNKALITSQLWKRLVNTAEYTPKPLSVYSVALKVANQVADQRLAALTHYRIGWFQFGQGNIPSAIDSYMQSKSAFATAQSKRDLIYILADLGTLYIYSSDYKQAKDYSQQSLAIAEEFKNSTAPSEWPDEYGVGTALSNLGNISKREGEYDKALDYFQKSFDLFKKIDRGEGRYTPQVIDSLADVGRTYSAQGDYVRALPYLDRAMSLARSSQNTNRIASTCNSLGILYTNQRDYSKAIDYFQQGLQLANQVNDRFKQASLLLNIAVAYQFQKQFPPALENFQKSLEVAKEINDRE